MVVFLILYDHRYFWKVSADVTATYFLFLLFMILSWVCVYKTQCQVWIQATVCCNLGSKLWYNASMESRHDLLLLLCFYWRPKEAVPQIRIGYRDSVWLSLFVATFVDSDYSHCFKVYPEHSIIESWLLRLLAENGCFTGEGVVPALHVDMDTRIRTRPCQIKQTSLWHLQGQHPGRVLSNSRNLRNKTISWFVVRGRNGQVWRLRWPLLLLVRRLEQKGYRIGFITRMVRRLLWQQLTFLAAWLFKKIIS